MSATQKVVQIRQQFNDASKTKGKQQLISPWTTNIIRCDKQSPLHVTYFSRTRQRETFSRAKCLNGQKDFLTNESGESVRRITSPVDHRQQLLMVFSFHYFCILNCCFCCGWLVRVPELLSRLVCFEVLLSLVCMTSDCTPVPPVWLRVEIPVCLQA